MIIFYNNQTGKIVGTIDGRIHTPEHLKMWIGSETENDRLVVDWKPVKWYNEKGKEVKENSKNIFSADFKPNHKQAEIFVEIEKNSQELKKYRVNIATKELVLI